MEDEALAGDCAAVGCGSVDEGVRGICGTPLDEGMIGVEGPLGIDMVLCRCGCV